MHGAKRVVMFCLLTAVLPTLLLVLPLYLRHSVFADVTFAVAESDVVEVVDGMSSVFCQAQSLRMNSSFHAFQLSSMPERSDRRKHVHLKKSMILPDDTLEYWGFFLPRGSSVVLSACSRYPGSRILVVKGEKNLQTCGLMDHSETQGPIHLAADPGQVRITLETPAEVIPDIPEDDRDLPGLEQLADRHLARHRLLGNQSGAGARHRHAKRREGSGLLKHSRSGVHRPKNSSRAELKKSLEKILNTDYGEKLEHQKRKNSRNRRNVNPGRVLDAGIGHGGNAGLAGVASVANVTHVPPEQMEESAASSFENDLFACYDGQILLANPFPSSSNCTGQHALASHQRTMKTIHDVLSDGYYYYIFYSDNDFVQNDIHATFDIHKPTYQYANFTKGCVNQTECAFPISFMSSEIVIVEVPTRDGIEHEEDDITLLISSCEPRMSVYVIFPIAVLFLILGCAFL
ncbi:uncharacterized protein LOC134535718 [Bacillus rossius redtenbacheri]|uniref:uncharacterized protein LOC134535718 n=1 Tax=Bacillus rossius redtenbacheri TaxID=93214 RepID=UPI002FDE7D57